MKRLLFAPLLIAGLQAPVYAMPWSNDIVVKTDIGKDYMFTKSKETS